MGTKVEAEVDLSIFQKPLGNMVNLTHGRVHYRWYGPEDGNLAVLVHGITSNEGVMSWLAKDLAEEGYRVLTFDLYGRGHSDNTPHGVEHTHELFTEQINDLLETLGLGDEKFDLVGYSMGGAISAIYTAQYGHRVEKLVLISPAGMPLEFPLAAKIGNLPYIGELMTSSSFFRSYWTSSAKESFIAPHVESEFAEYIVRLCHYHISKDNFFAALLSTLRNFPLNNAKEFYEGVAIQTQIPVLFVWGTKDQVCPYSGAAQATGIIPRAELVTLENAGHAALLENSTVVHSHIINFLNTDAACHSATHKNITYTSHTSNISNKMYNHFVNSITGSL